MRKLAMVAAIAYAIWAAQEAASAQELASYEPNGCQQLTSGRSTVEDREALYARATCVAARAGVAAPANGPLSQEELFSILMLMSLQQAPGTHAS
jgi:hypothetical protein